MNRERAETYLRLLAEAELRDPSLPAPRSGDAPFVTAAIDVTRAAWALTVVGVLDLQTAEAILADMELALSVRYRPPATVMVSPRLGARNFGGSRPLTRMGHLMPGLPARASGPVPPDGTASLDDTGRYVPVGQMILFHDEQVSGELDVMSYAHTAGGARFTAAWRTRDPLGAWHHALPPVEAFSLADDRGQHYGLEVAARGGPQVVCDLIVHPDPPPDIGWLEITAPGERAVRVDLGRRAERPEPHVSQLTLSSGEHLLNRIAERLLALAPEHRAHWQLQHAAAGLSPAHRTQLAGPVANLAAGLGATVAALEAAEVLPPLSPVPARLAGLCASLGIDDHGIAAAPALDLPEPWLSLLTHYHRRKPETAPAGDDFAAVAAALPDLEGIRLVLLGLHNYDGGTWMEALVRGQLPDPRQRVLGLDMAFPLSLWVRDGTGRWHAARPAGWFHGADEAALTLRLTPPLTRSCAWLDVLATGQSAEVRATVPLCWGYSP